MCGIVGLIGAPEASREAFLALTTLQHRGQDAAGILTYNTDGFHRVKNLGLVDSVFNRENMASLTGSIAVGHARYGTIGKGDLNEVQPFLLSYPFGLGMIHNGNIVNVEELRRDLKVRSKRHVLTHSDTEILMNVFADHLVRAHAQSPSQGQGPAHAQGSTDENETSDENETPELTFEHICAAVQGIFNQVNGSYSIISVIADHGLVAFRDPHGIRPLIWGVRPGKRANDQATSSLPTGEQHIVASESVALSFLGYDVVKNLEPGEVLFIDTKGQVHTRVLEHRKRRPCMFEWVYFASPESVIDNVPVYGTRIQLGKSLARLLKEQIKERGIEADIIVPVPETSRIAAIALAEELGIPYREVLIKNRYIKRTFILDSQDKRQSAVSLKLSPVRSEIEGKRVILVDDSIVRGTTSRKIIDLVRRAGASSVYFVSTCPPIQYPCYYGIDFPIREELIAYGRTEKEIEKDLGADAVIYQDHEGLKQAILEAGRSGSPVGKDAGASGAPFERPCMACLDGKYPTDVTAAGARFAAARTAHREASLARTEGSRKR